MAAEPATEPAPSACRRCGQARPVDEPDGLCPRCRLDGDGPDDIAGLFASTEAGRVLNSLTVTFGPLPRVHLADTADGLDEPPPIDPSSPEIPTAAERSCRVQLLGEIARGGMGVVLKGRDPDLGRDLAVKVLLDANREKPELVRRFVEEAQIGGQLQHPGIVPIYELGSFGDRRPYFTMKLVKGQTLAELLAGRASPSADQARFLGIFEQVCQTMAYAHARSVIHRDLKPSNIMVGSFGEVQVMDWGLAKVLARGGAVDDAAAGRDAPDDTVITTARPEPDSNLSQAGSVLGTPAYMAPEQARGEIGRVDERADVFALGSILCQILTGRPAFSGRSVGEIHRKAALGDLSEAAEALGASGADAELVALARDCLAREPEDRPPHAGAAADRIIDYHADLRDRLVAAQVARAAEEARAEESLRTAEAAEARTRAEHRARRLTGALAAAVLGAVLLGGAGWRWVEVQRLERVREAGAKVTAALQEATRLRGLAQGASVGDLGPWAAAAASAEKARDLLEDGVDPALRGHVEALAAEVDAERDRAVAADEAARRDHELLERLVDVRASKLDMPGPTADAAYAEAFRRAGFDLRALPASEAAERIRGRPHDVAVALAAALDDWADIRRIFVKDLAGAAALSALARAADPDPWRNRLRDALESPDPASRTAALRKLAESAPYDALGPVSLDLLGAKMSVSGDPASAEAILRRAQRRFPGDVWINYDLAATLERLSRPEEAIRYYIAARSIRPETAHELAHALDKKGEYDEAIAVFQELTRRRPGDVRHLSCLGHLLEVRGRKEEARVALDEAVASSREHLRQDPNDALTRTMLAQALMLQNKPAEAADEIREALRLRPDDARFHYNLGHLLLDQKKPDEALVEIREAIRLQPDDGASHSCLGTILVEFKRDDAAAEAAFREAIRLRPDDANAYNGLGAALFNLGRLDEAIVATREAIRLRPDFADFRNNLGKALARLGKADDAIAAYREFLRLRPGDAEAHARLGSVFADLKHDYPAAEAAFREAVRLKPDEASYHAFLGNILAFEKKADDAVAEYRESIRLKPGDAAVHIRLGDALGDLEHDYAAASDAYREAIRLKPDAGDAHHGLGVALLRLGKSDEPVAELREAIRLRPDHAQYHATLGLILETLKKPGEAIPEYREALRLHPDNLNAAMGLARALMTSRGDPEGIIDALKGVARLMPVDPKVRNELAWRLALAPGRPRADYDAAVEYARKAVELDPKNASFANTMALAEYRAGDWGRCIAAAERSMALGDGGDPSDRFFLAMAHGRKGDGAEARKRFDEGVAMTRRKSPANTELRRFWKEAADLLGLPGPDAPEPARSASPAVAEPR